MSTVRRTLQVNWNRISCKNYYFYNLLYHSDLSDFKILVNSMLASVQEGPISIYFLVIGLKKVSNALQEECLICVRSKIFVS